MTDTKRVQLALATPNGRDITLNLTSDGKTEVRTMTREAAASLVARIARALAEDS